MGLIALATGAVLGGLFQAIERAGVPNSTNCSFLAGPITDFFAFGGAAFLIVDAYFRENDGKQTPWTFGESMLGGAIVAIHSIQLLAPMG